MNGAVLAVCPSWAAPVASPSEVGARHDDRARALSDRLVAVAGHVVATDGELLLALVPVAADAVHVALDLLRREPGASIAIGWIESASAGPPVDADASRARRIAWRCGPGVRCTVALRAALGPIPAGVGLFEVPHDVAHRLACPAFELADHRGATT